MFQKVKRLFGDPHQTTEDLKSEVITTGNLYTVVSVLVSVTKFILLRLLSKIKGKLSDHEGKLREAEDLLYSAQGKTRQAGSLAAQNQANFAALEV